MLKIYLDWNIISDIEGRHPKLLSLIEEYGDLFIFPYSNAHIRDLMVSHTDDNPYFDKDLDMLTKICGKHHLAFENDTMKPLFGYPRDYVNSCGNLLEIIQKTEFISPQTYVLLKEQIRNSIPEKEYKRIQGAQPKDALKFINYYISSQMPGASIESLVTSDLNVMKNLMNLEARFKSVCIAIEMFGFSPEKKDKQFTNIDTDASHIFYGAHCDLFVSSDKKLRAKADAMYKGYNLQTQVLTPQQLEELLPNEASKEYSLDNLLRSIEQYGHPRIEPDGAHYTLMRTPVFGLFNACMIADENIIPGNTNPSSALFTYCFNNVPYLYYTELEHFLNLIKQLYSPQDMEIFQKQYIDELCSCDKDRAMKAICTLDCPDLNLLFAFYGDPLSPVPCPMMQVKYK